MGLKFTIYDVSKNKTLFDRVACQSISTITREGSIKRGRGALNATLINTFHQWDDSIIGCSVVMNGWVGGGGCPQALLCMYADVFDS